MEKCLLEDMLDRIDDIGEFEDIASCTAQSGGDKKLYVYQQEALYNCLKLLYVYYKDYRAEGENTDKSKKRLMDMYDGSYPGFSWENRLKKYSNEKKRTLNEKFSCFVSSRYYELSYDHNEEYIGAQNFYNRCAFWMATGSGKSVVIVKLIDMLRQLMDARLIPEKQILLLTPKEYIIKQIMEVAEEFNTSPESTNEIAFHSLKEYESFEKPVSSGATDVFFYRSDLIREMTTENFISHDDIDHDGNWYMILDEAHRGDHEYSLSKGYFSALTRNGFLFNFSATFADAIDFQTTVYNFNLEKFIDQEYGKNILVSKTLYTFKNSETELDELEKQKEVLKAFIVYTAVKQSRRCSDSYHSPLFMTLVGTVNTRSSDLNIYFRIMEQAATGKIKEDLFLSARQELLDEEICGNTIRYSVGSEALDVSGKRYAGRSFAELISGVTMQSILKELFNSSTCGRIEFIHSEDIQEIGMKLETSDKIFGLIKIGERDKFEKSIMTDQENYSLTKSISVKDFFGRIETDDHINMLCGSRAFYEGWDTNRPNVINLIDIGSREAQKFVPQAIGRGIRIKPNDATRKRLAHNDPEKNQLLETLFVFATSRDVLDAIGAFGNKHRSEEKEYGISAGKNKKTAVRPSGSGITDKESGEKDLPKYGISENSYNNFRKFMNSFRYEVLFLKYGLRFADYCLIKENLPEDIDDSSLFIAADREYSDMPWLLKRVNVYLQRKKRGVYPEKI